MGTWDSGVLDNDSALDALGALTTSIAQEIVRLGAQPPSQTTTGRLCGAVGALLQLSAYEFGRQPRGSQIAAAAKAYLKEIALSPQSGRDILERVAAGQGKALAEEWATLPVRDAESLHAAGKASFGKRRATLFESHEAKAYLQELADECVKWIDEDLEAEDNWTDLCREASALGCLAPLIVLEPCQVPQATLKRWQSCARTGLATLERTPDGELPFHRRYYANLDALFNSLLRKFA